LVYFYRLNNLLLKKLYRNLFLICVAMAFTICANAQCSNPISTFPYTQDFEANDGGWVTGGTASDWGYGNPRKPIINKAASGSNCWVTGGTTDGFYNNSEASWIQSPCFDLSSLQYPQIAFNIWSETEKNYDGAGFQYSLDGGNSWEDAGSAGDATDCSNQNWFNVSSVRYLGLMNSGNGWSGTIPPAGGGHGWVLAKKTLMALAGKSKVIFRFVFGSGSINNNFDGFAMDDFSISNAPVLTLSTTVLSTIKCNGDKNGSVEVKASGSSGPYTYSWNTNPVQINATAVNLSAGTYTVTVAAPNVCPTKSTIILSEPAPLDHTVTSINPGCVAAAGSININETGGTAPYTYSWSPNVSNTSSATGLLAGKYDITVTDKSLCTDLISVEIVNVIPPAITIDSKTDVTCNGGNNGSITATVSGGEAPVTYSWDSDPEQTTTTASNLKAGNYTLTVKDANNCVSKSSVTINEPPATTVTVTTRSTTCGLPIGSINLSPSGNVNNYQYTWTPAVSSTNIANNIKAGRYNVELKDAAGCITTVPEIRLINTGAPTKIFIGKDTTICSGEKVVLSTRALGNFLWQDNSTAPSYTANQTGKYFLRLTNGDGCVSSDTININVVTNCVDIYFPSVFSPNNDGLNDQFGPIGNLNAVSNYHLSVYNRWGNVVFTSTDPRKRWNGETNSSLTADAAYTWFASYIFDGGAPKFKKGVLVIVR
jgi:gliding motility-associated-like protein